MKILRGKFDTGPGAVVTEGATLYHDDKPQWTSAHWWPVRRVFGISGRRFMLGLVLMDKPQFRRMEHRE